VLIIVVRTLILYILVVIIMRIMGKRQIGQLQPFELVIAIMISELAAVPMQDKRIPLILLTNYCVYDCAYCVNRVSNDIPRAAFTPQEVANLTINFYRRNYIEGLFLSSAVVKNPNHTMELLYESLRILRKEYRFNGYIHVKAIPGADLGLIEAVGKLADRMSVNIELPSENGLKLLALKKINRRYLSQ